MDIYKNTQLTPSLSPDTSPLIPHPSISISLSSLLRLRRQRRRRAAELAVVGAASPPSQTTPNSRPSSHPLWFLLVLRRFPTSEASSGGGSSVSGGGHSFGRLVMNFFWFSKFLLPLLASLSFFLFLPWLFNTQPPLLWPISCEIVGVRRRVFFLLSFWNFVRNFYTLIAFDFRFSPCENERLIWGFRF